MIFESIAAVTAAISGINSLVSAVKEGNANVNSILDRMTGIQDGMNKLELEKREKGRNFGMRTRTLCKNLVMPMQLQSRPLLLKRKLVNNYSTTSFYILSLAW